MKVFVILIQLLILLTNIPMLMSTLKHSLTMLDSLLVVSCVNRWALSAIKGAVPGEFKSGRFLKPTFFKWKISRDRLWLNA
jgi:hypothetical protein